MQPSTWSLRTRRTLHRTTVLATRPITSARAVPVTNDPAANELVDSYEYTHHKRAFVYRDQTLSGDEVVKTRVRQDHWLRFQDFLDYKDHKVVLGVGKTLIFVKSVCKADPSKVVRSAISEV